MAQLTCQNLKLGYDGKTVAENINFSVNRGDYLCIVGENGSGKTTLIKTILGLLSPIDGEILTDKAFLGQKIGYLPQQTAIQKDFPACVDEIVLSGCIQKNGHFFYTKEDRKKALAALEKLNISELKNKSYKELSGGQQQRVLLARALCATGDMLLLDEPAASLDPKATSELYTVIKDLNEQDNTTVIMISHNIDAAIKFATHILHIGSTQLFFGTVADYTESDAFKTFNTDHKGDYYA